MKKIVLLIGLIVNTGAALFAQNAALPQLAVVEFSTNDNVERTKQNAVTMRNLVEAQMISSGRFLMITRGDIDKLLENQRIQVSSISSADNIKKLQLQNISYIVTGSVDALGDDYAITVRLLDVSTGWFSHSGDGFMGGSSRDLYDGIKTLMAGFIAGIGTDKSGSIVQSQQFAANSAQNHLERGKLFFNRSDYNNAILELNEAIKLDSNLAEAHAYRSSSYNGQQKYDQALSDANIAIRLNPNLAFAYFIRGTVYGFKGDNDRAIADYTQAIRLDPNDAQVYFTRGVAHESKRDYNKAIEDYEAALRLNPNYATAKSNLDRVRASIATKNIIDIYNRQQGGTKTKRAASGTR